jgi:hypothetical protein
MEIKQPENTRLNLILYPGSGIQNFFLSASGRRSFDRLRTSLFGDEENDFNEIVFRLS